MMALIPHPASCAPPGVAVSAGVRVTASGLALSYRLRGPLDCLVLPAAGPVRRGADLWRSTCFEAFVCAPSGAYGEINLAPDGSYCAYLFDAYRRQGARDWEPGAPGLAVARAGDTLTMEAIAPMTDPVLAGPVKIGLSAVIQSASRDMSFWALAHPLERPDFHHPGGFMLDVELPA